MSHVFRPGDQVVLVLREGTSPSRCQSGEVREVDEHGVRVALRHWAIDVDPMPGLDFFAAWSSITAALVAAAGDDWEAFRETAEVFHRRCREMH